MALVPGTIRVTVEYAKGLKDAEWFGKNDPYAILKVGSQQFRTRTLKSAGTNPVWDEKFSFQVLNENALEIIIYDEDVIKDDYLGTATIMLAKTREQRKDRVQAPVMQTNHKQKGFIAVDLEFEPNSSLMPQQYAAPCQHGAPPAPCQHGIPPGYAPQQSQYPQQYQQQYQQQPHYQQPLPYGAPTYAPQPQMYAPPPPSFAHMPSMHAPPPHVAYAQPPPGYGQMQSMQHAPPQQMYATPSYGHAHSMQHAPPPQAYPAAPPPSVYYPSVPNPHGGY